MRRTASGLPRVNRLTDLYNAISLLHLIPLGGEDMSTYDGAPHLIRATGSEPFEIMTDGAPTTEKWVWVVLGGVGQNRQHVGCRRHTIGRR